LRGLVPGPWLRELKRRWQSDKLSGGSIDVTCAAAQGPCSVTFEDAADLYQQIRTERPAASLGYVTDFGFSEANRATLRELLTGTSLLCCECTFMAADRDKARASSHLCSSDLKQLVKELQPKALLPMHLSKAYIRRPEAIYDEIDLPPVIRLLRLPPYLTPRPKLLMELPPANDNM